MKTTKTLLASLFLAAMMGGTGFAADEPATTAADPAQREQELAAALKKCDGLAAAEKQKCVEAAKKKFGQM